MFCPNCGAPNDTHANQCGSCGTVIGAQPQGGSHYPAAPQQGQNVNMAAAAYKPHKTWAIGMIVAGVFCCNPLTLILGIVSMVYSGKATEAMMNGDEDGAYSAANTAKICAIVASVLIGLTILGTCGSAATGGLEQFQGFDQY